MIIKKIAFIKIGSIKQIKNCLPGSYNIIKSSYLSFDSIEDTTELTYSGVSFQ